MAQNLLRNCFLITSRKSFRSDRSSACTKRCILKYHFRRIRLWHRSCSRKCRDPNRSRGYLSSSDFLSCSFQLWNDWEVNFNSIQEIDNRRTFSSVPSDILMFHNLLQEFFSAMIQFVHELQHLKIKKLLESTSRRYQIIFTCCASVKDFSRH